MVPFCRLLLLSLLAFTGGCGLEELLAGMTGETQGPSGQAAQPTSMASDTDADRALFGEMFSSQFVPRSIIFATGLNPNGLEETHILASSARNYCEHIRDGIEEERSLRVMLRVVRYIGDGATSHAGPGEYRQTERVLYYNDTLGVASPGQVPVENGEGNTMTAAVARVRRGCRGQRLVAASPDSAITIDAHDMTGLRGHMSLRFDNYGMGDSAGDGGDTFNGMPVRVGGAFTATPCPFLGRLLDRDPQTPFQALQCMPQTN